MIKISSINKYLIAISIIAIIASSGFIAAKYSNFNDLINHKELNNDISVSATNRELTVNKRIDVNVGETGYITLDETPFKSLPSNRREEILQKISNGIRNDSLNGIIISTDDLDNTYLKVIPTEVKNYEFTVNDFAETTDSSGKTKYNMKIQIGVTHIKTSVNFDTSLINTNNVNPSQWIDINLKGFDFAQGENYYSNKSLPGNLNVKLVNLDNFDDNIDETVQISADINGNARLYLSNFESLAKGRPGRYTISAEVTDDIYVKSKNQIDIKNPKFYNILPLQGWELYFDSFTDNFDHIFPFLVEDYYHTPITNIELDINGQKLTTDENGIVYYNYNAKFEGLKVTDEQHITAQLTTPSIDGQYNSPVISTFVKTERFGGTDKSVCLRTQSSASITNTFNAPNGMSITAKGGSFGLIAQYKISWFDENKYLISTNEENYYEVGAKDRRFYVPAGAYYMKIKIGCKDTGKDKPETDYLRTGNAIVFWEGLASTENAHIAVQNPNGYEILREDYKC